MQSSGGQKAPRAAAHVFAFLTSGKTRQFLWPVDPEGYPFAHGRVCGTGAQPTLECERDVPSDHRQWLEVSRASKITRKVVAVR